VQGKDRLEGLVLWSCDIRVQNEWLITTATIYAKFRKGTGIPKKLRIRIKHSK